MLFFCSHLNDTDMKIIEMTAAERPRERMEKYGERALSNAELLAIILRSGTPGCNILEVARQLLGDGGLKELGKMSLGMLKRVKGVGDVKAQQVVACMELSRRLLEEENDLEYKVIRTPHDAYRNLLPLYTTSSLEECWCIFLKRNRHVIGSMMVSRGGENSTSMNIKPIIRKAMDLGASAIIVSHNHPSGDMRPSTEDVRVTEQLDDALKTFEMSLMDHLILSEHGYFSFSENESFTKSGRKCKKM